MGAEDDCCGRRRRGAGRFGLTCCAVVERFLDAGGGEFLRIGEGDDAVIGGDVGREGDAGRRDLRLGDGAGVLGVGGQRNKKWKGNK